MRTLLPEELKEQPLIRLAVGFTLIVMLGFVFTGFLLHFQHMDLSPSSVESYYTGSAEQYKPGRSIESMLSATHAHTIGLAVALLLLSLLLIRSSVSEGLKKTLIVVPFASGILEEAASWLVRYGVPGSAWLKILSFLALYVSLFILILVLFSATFRGVRKPAEPIVPQRPTSPPQGGGGPQRRQPQGSPQGDFRRRRRRPRRRRGGRGPGGGQAPSQGQPPPTQ